MSSVTDAMRRKGPRVHNEIQSLYLLPKLFIPSLSLAEYINARIDRGEIDGVGETDPAKDDDKSRKTFASLFTQ